MAINLLYKHEWPINDKINVVIPTIREIIRDEDAYYGLISIFTASPYDMMLALDDAGYDFRNVNSFELFLMLFGSLREMDVSLVLGDIDLTKFLLKQSESNGQIVLHDPENDIVIDRAIHEKIAVCLRTIHGLEKNNRTVQDDETKKYLLERARKKRGRKSSGVASQLETLITAMVNTEQFKYNYETVLDLTIYQFNESVRQIIKKVDYDNRMYGIYSGTISANDIKKDELNWLVH